VEGQGEGRGKRLSRRLSNRTDGVQAAVDAAISADAVVMALGIDKSIEREALDRKDTALPGIQEAFAKSVLALNKPTVLLLTNGGALAIDDLINRSSSSVPYAIVEAFNPAVVGGRAIASSLFGVENRWGKLPVTLYPHSFIRDKAMSDYNMTSGVGRTYKYFKGVPLFPFGHGLSLTRFTMACHETATAADAAKSLLTLDGLSVLKFECTVANIGSRAGDEVVQVYHVASDIGTVDHPLPRRTLIDFVRVSVAAATAVKVDFSIDRTGLQVVNKQGKKVLYPGLHQLIFSRGHGEELAFTVAVSRSFSVDTNRSEAASIYI